MSTTTTLSFKPWAHDADQEPSLKDVLARVSLERGHFRNITEASLQEEVAGEGALEPSDDERESDEEDEKEEVEEGAKGPQTREDLYKAKFEMLQHVGAAEQDVLFALDFVSLLMTKDKEGAALGNQSISPALKNEVPAKTLGLDVWQRMPDDKGVQAQDEMLATNVRMEGLQKSADGLLAAASRLEDNVRKETQYWDEVLSIAEKGWNICRIPGQQHRLGVTFGFSESEPQFSRRGIAALNVDEDGQISLDRGVGAKPKAVRVLLRQQGRLVGSSNISSTTNDSDITLEARIRHARDSLFDEELYQELVREGRANASLGVTLKGDSVCFAPLQEDATRTEISFELVSLDDTGARDLGVLPQDNVAQAVAVAARLLLTQAHRERLKRRSEVPPPMTDKKEERRILPILRPVMSFALHRFAVNQVNSHLARIAQLTRAAQVQCAFENAVINVPSVEDLSGAEDLVTKLLQPWASEAKCEVASLGIRVQLETTLVTDFCTRFTLIAPNNKVTQFAVDGELRNAIDAAVSSALAASLAVKAGEGWRCNQREAFLENEAAGGKAWVLVDGGAGILTLSGQEQDKSRVWRLEGESAQKSLWEVFGEVIY
ncbi:hypothetical protein KC352_g15071 [Hortaea werneckii]|nr:hypothetical protein KC352_g15071 [Hortaea werneckii]